MINVYYVTAPKEIAIEIPQTGVELTMTSKNNYNLFIILLNLLSLAFAIKRKEEN